MSDLRVVASVDFATLAVALAALAVAIVVARRGISRWRGGERDWLAGGADAVAAAGFAACSVYGFWLAFTTNVTTASTRLGMLALAVLALGVSLVLAQRVREAVREGEAKGHEAALGLLLGAIGFGACSVYALWLTFRA